MSRLEALGARMPVLRGDRVVLRHPVAEDAPQVLEIFGDADAMRYWSHEPFTEIGAAAAYVDRIHAGFAERRLIQWAVTLASDDVLIGTVTLVGFDWRSRRCELGYMLSPREWGRGLASEAVHRVLQFAFDELDLHRVEADVDPRNAASARLLERLGFVREGLLRDRWYTYGEFSDSALYGLLRGELAPVR